jgi:MFS family permease
MFNIAKIFPSFLKREIGEFYITVSIQTFALSMISLFEPIYLFKLGFSIPQILLFFISVYLIFFFIIPLSGKIINYFGFEHSIFLSIPFCILYFLSLYLISFYSFFIFIAPVFLVIYKMLYWPSYHANFAKYGIKEQIGKEIGALKIIGLLIGVIGPFIGGLIIASFGFNVLFIIVSCILFVSIIPLFTTKEKFISQKFSYKDCFKRLFSKENKKNMWKFIGIGEELINLVLWPIFIFLIIKNYSILGGVVSLSILVSVFATFYIGYSFDNGNGKRILRKSLFPYFIFWIIRGFIKNISGIFIIELFARIFRSGIFIPLTAHTYKMANQYGTLKYAIFFEQSLTIGKISIALIAFLLFTFCGVGFWIWTIIFFIAGLYSLLYYVDSK